MARSLINRFMEAVLGEEAAHALKKAADQSGSIDSVLGPRAILGWLKLQSRWGYEGEVPGMPGSYLAFAKSERGFTGELRWGKHTYEFNRQDVTHVAAALSCALGCDKPIAKSLRDNDLVALGENIDLLVKTRFLTKAEESSGGPDCPKCGSDNCHPLTGFDPGEHDWDEERETIGHHCNKCHHEWSGSTEKFEAPGPQAGQNAPSAQTPPQAQTPKAPSRSKKRGFQAKLTASQAKTKCSVCDAPQFSGDVFVGCHCLRDLAKHASAEAAPGGYIVTFGSEWSKQDIAVLVDIVGGNA